MEEEASFLTFVICHLLIMLIVGLATACSVGGNTINVAIMMLFLHFPLQKSYLIGFIILFGGSVGNVLNQSMKTDYRTNRTPINYKAASIIAPCMIIGTNIGLPLNQILPEIAIVIGLYFFIISSLTRIIKKIKQERARKAEEKEELDVQVSSQVIESGVDISLPSEHLLETEAEGNDFQSKMRLAALVVMSIALISVKGSKNIESLVGIQTCSIPYWLTYPALFLIVYLVLPSDFSPLPKPETLKNGIFAGLGAGTLGVGGGVWMLPIMVNSGITIHSATATVSVNVLMTAFVNFIQAVFMGVLSGWEVLFYLGISIFSGYAVGSVIVNLMNKLKRQELVLEIMVVIALVSLVIFPIHMLGDLFGEGNFKGIFKFQSLCN